MLLYVEMRDDGVGAFEHGRYGSEKIRHNMRRFNSGKCSCMKIFGLNRRRKNSYGMLIHIKQFN